MFKKVKKSGLRKELSHYKLLFFLYFFGFWIAVSFFAHITISPSVEYALTDYDSYYSTKIYFDKLNETQEQIVKEDVMGDLKEDYLKIVKSINFTTSRYVPCKVKGECGGSNTNGVIYIIYEDDVEWMRMAVCHEIVHSLMNSDYRNKIFDEESFTWDIGKTLVCFEEDWD